MNLVKTKMPSISIIMVSYNQGKLIEQSILSVINQDYPNLDFIIIDGGSTDGTLDIIKKYGDKINTFHSEPDKGMYHARNKGIFVAKGDYIGFLNTDDIYFPNALKELGRKIVETDYADMIYGYTIGLSKEGEEMQKVFFGKDINTDKIVYFRTMKTIPDQSTFYKRSSLSFVGIYDTSLKFGADTDLKCRFIKKGLRICVLQQKIAGWRIYDEALTFRPGFKNERFKEAVRLNYHYTGNWISYYTIRLFLYNYIVPIIKRILKLNADR